jgi:putative tryptophan/tyrosine transport system substrate-binding protein
MRRAMAEQTTKVYRIAMVNPSTPVAEMTEAGGNPQNRALFEELRRLGYVEGRNLVVERYSGEGRADHYPELARDVVHRNPDLIFVNGSRLTFDFKGATATIPIVAFTGDPVAYGIVPNLARPGGNITGISLYAGLGILGKRLELLREAIPRVSRVAYLVSPAEWEGIYGAAMREAAQSAGVSLVRPRLAAPFQEAEYRRAFAAMVQEGAQALIVGDQTENLTNRRLILELAERARLPAMYGQRQFADLGGLMVYAADLPDLFQRIANHIDLILKGTPPGEIPFYQPTKFQLVVNLKTARALGIELPGSLLARADELIE